MTNRSREDLALAWAITRHHLTLPEEEERSLLFVGDLRGYMSAHVRMATLQACGCITDRQGAVFVPGCDAHQTDSAWRPRDSGKVQRAVEDGLRTALGSIEDSNRELLQEMYLPSRDSQLKHIFLMAREAGYDLDSDDGAQAFIQAVHGWTGKRTQSELNENDLATLRTKLRARLGW